MAPLFIPFGVLVFICALFVLHNLGTLKDRLSKQHPALLYAIIVLPFLLTYIMFDPKVAPASMLLAVLFCIFQFVTCLLAAQAAMILWRRRKWNGIFVGLSTLCGALYVAITLMFAFYATR